MAITEDTYTEPNLLSDALNVIITKMFGLFILSIALKI